MDVLSEVCTHVRLGCLVAEAGGGAVLLLVQVGKLVDSELEALTLGVLLRDECLGGLELLAVGLLLVAIVDLAELRLELSPFHTLGEGGECEEAGHVCKKRKNQTCKQNK